MSAASNVARPGIRWGVRPERAEPKNANDFDRAWQRFWLARPEKHLRSFHQFAAHLQQITEFETQFRQLDLASRNSVVFGMRQKLKSSQQEASALVEVFAVIRLAIQQSLNIRLHDEQLYAGWCLHEGLFIEMQTGEGKTLTAALPAIAMALAGVPVHVITSNEYLARRDLESLSSVFNWFGLTSAVVLADQDDSSRKQAYECDIVYCTHPQLVFDYLRDSRSLDSRRTGVATRIQDLLRVTPAQTLQRGLCFAIIDEADSVLIDDARTPLILAEAVNADNEMLAEAAVALAIARALNREHFSLDLQKRQVQMTDAGAAHVEQQVIHLTGIWKMPRYRNERIVQALTAIHIYLSDVDYLVDEDKVVLVDQSTGRPMPQRRLQHGLHQMLEVKERCNLGDETCPTLALSFQRFFTRYHRLSGMSGTLQEASSELRRVYGAQIVVIPSVKPSQRQKLPTKIFNSREEQLSALHEAVTRLRSEQRAVLIGTRTVAMSEAVSAALNRAGIENEVLNARQDADEAMTISAAGEAGRVTVATNMAGRGTDIKCSDTTLQNGGLHVLNLEVNDASRICRQLHGRAARQGQPGSHQDFLCVDDVVLVNELSHVSLRLLRLSIAIGLAGTFASLFVRKAQKAIEKRHKRQRIDMYCGQTRLQRSLAIGGYDE